MGGERIKPYLKIGITTIFFLFILFFSAGGFPDSVIHETESDAQNPGSIGAQESLAENTMPLSEGQLNSSKNESSEPVAIALEKPPFID